MELKRFLKCVLKGEILALILSFIAMFIFSIIMNNVEFKEGLFNIIYIIISIIAIMLGALVSVKSYGSKGWLVGLVVGCVFYIAFYLIASLFGESLVLTTYDFIKFFLCALVGLLSGIIGINL